MDIVSKALLFTLYHFIWYLENESTTSVTMTLSPLPTITIMTATCLEDYLGSDHVPVSQIVPYKHHLAWSSQKDMRENYIIIFYSREDWGRKRWIFLVTWRLENWIGSWFESYALNLYCLSILLIIWQPSAYYLLHSHSNRVYVLTSNDEEAEVERFYEDLWDLQELTPPKDVFFIIGDWSAKVGSQETPGVTANLALEYKMKQGNGQQSSAKRTHWS